MLCPFITRLHQRVLEDDMRAWVLLYVAVVALQLCITTNPSELWQRLMPLKLIGLSGLALGYGIASYPASLTSVGAGAFLVLLGLPCDVLLHSLSQPPLPVWWLPLFSLLALLGYGGLGLFLRHHGVGKVLAGRCLIVMLVLLVGVLLDGRVFAGAVFHAWMPGAGQGLWHAGGMLSLALVAGWQLWRVADKVGDNDG